MTIWFVKQGYRASSLPVSRLHSKGLGRVIQTTYKKWFLKAEKPESLYPFFRSAIEKTTTTTSPTNKQTLGIVGHTIINICFSSQLTVTAGAAGPEVLAVAGDTLLILMAVETLTRSISRQMVTSFCQVTVCGESTAVQLLSGSRFVCTVEAT